MNSRGFFRGRIRSFFIVLILLLCFSLSGQDGDPDDADNSSSAGPPQGAEELLSDAREAIRRESWTFALDLLTEGENLYPEDYRIPHLLGELYSSQELYNLALESFLLADKLNPGDLKVMSAAARAYGRLNRNRESVEMMENILEIHPDSIEAVSDLGWMYFKTYRSADGERLLKKAMDEHGETPGLLMTLGTLYTSLYDYENGRDHYLRSIEAADEMGWDYFSSVAYYNLALLDFAFYQYENSMEEALKSVDIAKRSSGYICLGELAVTKMDYSGALDAFTQAYNQDETPLSLISLAQLYHKFGMLDAALSHAREAAERADSSWMYYFGVDPDRHLMDLHQLYGDIYESMALNEIRAPELGPDRIVRLFRSLKYRVFSWYYSNSRKKLSVRVGKAFEDEGNSFDADLQYFHALEDYSPEALRYLKKCEDFEMSVAPESYPFYRYEEGRIKKDPVILYEALKKLDPHWEKSTVDLVLTALVPLIRGSEKDEALNILYDINPGAFVREGMDLPVILNGNISGPLKRLLERGGLDIRTDGSAGVEFELRIDEAGNTCYYSCWDVDEGRTLWTDRIDIKGEGRKGIEETAYHILNRIFMPR